MRKGEKKDYLSSLLFAMIYVSVSNNNVIIITVLIKFCGANEKSGELTCKHCCN